MTQVWDAAIVGAGAAGLMTAIQIHYARNGLSIFLLDSKDKIGAKILMSGGTRCNLTNKNVTEADFQTEQKNILRSILKAFSSQEAIRFFRDLGVEVVLEPGGKYFPTAHSGRTILDALTKAVESSGVELKTGCKVTAVRFAKGLFILEGAGFSYAARAVVLTTGGLSFPATGSDGTGYEIAKSFGHSLIPTSPSLTPLITDDEDWKKLTGAALSVRLTFWVKQKKAASYEGPMLFTHFGFSGPVVLNLSRHWIREKEGRVTAAFLPDIKEEKFRAELLEQSSPRQFLKSFLAGYLPARFVEIFLGRLKIPAETTLAHLKKADRENLVRALYHTPLSVAGDKGYEKAEVTAGGVDLREIDKRTMQSKLAPGLFFAGEILDADGRIGGFNFQWAWASGTAAARGAAEFLSSKNP